VWISPEQLVTEYIERLIRNPGALHVVDFADGRVRLVGMQARKGGLLVGQQLRTLRDHMPNAEARIAAIYRNGRFIEPEGETMVEEGDEIFFVAARDNIQRMMSEITRAEEKVRKVVIAGGGNIGFRLARALENTNQVKLIERGFEQARQISEDLDRALVLHGDAADEELLLEENIDSADVFVAVTNAEEANILSAMLAKRLGARKVLARINRPAYAELVEAGTIDIAISPKEITLGTLLAHVRRGDVVKVHSLRRGAAEAIEAVAHGSARRSRVVGRTIEEVRLPRGAAINAIVRGDRVMMAHHDTLIEEDDHVILFVADRRQIDEVERLFEVDGGAD
jgi:trk system potassium uptake protein TrkA